MEVDILDIVDKDENGDGDEVVQFERRVDVDGDGIDTGVSGGVGRL